MSEVTGDEMFLTLVMFRWKEAVTFSVWGLNDTLIQNNTVSLYFRGGGQSDVIQRRKAERFVPETLASKNRDLRKQNIRDLPGFCL